MARESFNRWSCRDVLQASVFSDKSSAVGGKYSLEILLKLIKQYTKQMNSRNHVLVCVNVLPLKVAENHPLQLPNVGRSSEKLAHFIDSSLCSQVAGISIDTSADSSESNALQVILNSQLQTTSVARTKQSLGTTGIDTPFAEIDWTNCVDDVLTG